MTEKSENKIRHDEFYNHAIAALEAAEKSKTSHEQHSLLLISIANSQLALYELYKEKSKKGKLYTAHIR